MRSVGGLTIGDSCDRTCVQHIREYRTRPSMDPSANSIESIIVTHMIAAGPSSRHLHSSYVFEDMYPEFDIAYGGEESTLHYEERNRLRQIIFGDSEYEPMGHEISRETLRIYAVKLTRLGIMNFRFRGPGLPGDHDYKIRMVYFEPFPQVGSIVAAVASIPWDDNDPEEVE
jgi:hypothetical protein